MRVQIIGEGDPEKVDGWTCPHCEALLRLEAVASHVRTHDCPGCMLEIVVVQALIAEQRRRRLN